MFKVNREQLATEIGLLQTVAEKKGTIPALAYLLFQIEDNLLTITGTDMDMSLSVQVDVSGEPWSGGVPSKQLYDLSKLLSDAEIEFTPKDNGRIQVGKGKSRHLLLTIDPEHFPAIDKVDTQIVSVDGKALRVAVERGLQCVGNTRSDNVKDWWMQGLAFRSIDKRLHIAGTNSRHFAVSQIDALIDSDVIIPTRACQSLAKIIEDGPAEIGVTENHAVFRQGARLFVTRLLVGKFPDWRLFLPESFQHSTPLDAELARLAVRLASVTAEESLFIPIPLTVTFSKNEILLETKETDKGYSAQSLAVEIPSLNGDALKAGANGAHFLQFLEPGTKPILKFNGDMKMFRLSYEDDPDYCYVTMSLRA